VRRRRVTQLDADSVTPGLQATANVPLGGKIKASVVATVKLENVISVSTKIPFRCTFDVNAVALDTDPDVDDAATRRTTRRRWISRCSTATIYRFCARGALRARPDGPRARSQSRSRRSRSRRPRALSSADSSRSP
jgi:hypothetical protein